METFWDSRCPREKIFERKSVEFYFQPQAERTGVFGDPQLFVTGQTNHFVHIKSENKGCFCFGGLIWFETYKHTMFFLVSRRSSQRKVEEQTPFPQWTQWICNYVDSANPTDLYFEGLNVTSRELDVDSRYLYKNRRKFMRFKIQSIFFKFPWIPFLEPCPLFFFEETFRDDSGPS